MGRIKPQTLLQQSKNKKRPSTRSVPTLVACNIIIVLLMFSLVLIYRNRANRRQSFSTSGSNSHEEIANFERIGKANLPSQAVLNTTKGIITIQLFGKTSASIVSKFVEQSQHGYFDGHHFYRVIKHIVIQGGDPKLAGAREDWTNGGELTSQLEFSPKHEAFMVGTSKPENSRETFDLYITTAPIPDLNAKIAVFGHVIKGTEVVQEIEEVDTDEHFKPKSPVIINGVSFKDEL